MKYRDDLTEKQLVELMKEFTTTDEAYKVADRMWADFDKHFPADAEAVDEMEELRKAALNHKGEP